MFDAWASSMAGSGRLEELRAALASVVGEERARIAAASVMASVPSAAKRAKVPQAGEGKTDTRQDRLLVRRAPSPPPTYGEVQGGRPYEGRGSVTAERDGKSRRTGQPDLLASLPAERPPASQPAPGIDPASIEKLLTGVRDLREQFAGLREAVTADRPASAPEAVPEALTLEALEAWGDKHVARVAEAARPADTPGDDAAAGVADHIGRMEDAAARAAAATERIDGRLKGTADRVTAEIGAAATRIEAGFRITRDHVTRQSRLVHGAVEELRTHTAGRRFGWRTVFVWLIVFVAGMLLESRIHILYNWL